MATEIHFRKLVEQSGVPEVAVLWADPKKDRQFMSQVKTNRILTLLQKPTGGKRDFGLIGFHPQPFAAYLIFPKPLKNDPDTRVIGIKYDLLHPETEPVAVPRKPIAKPSLKTLKLPPPIKRVEVKKSPPPPKSIPAPKPVPVPHAFEVTIRRTAIITTKLTLLALTKTEAHVQALAKIKSEELIAPAIEVKNKIIAVVPSLAQT